MFGFLKSLGDTVSRIDGLSKVAAMLAGMLGTVSGHEPPPDAPPEVKGMNGILGLGDERKWLTLLEAVDKDVPGSAVLLTEFKGWAFKYEGVSTLVKWYIKLAENRFRTLIIEMGTSEGAETGSKTTTVNGKVNGVTFREVRTEKLRISGVSNPKQLVLRMVRLIQENKSSDTKKGKLKGFRACRVYLENNGVPFPKQATIERLERLEATSRQRAVELWPQAFFFIKQADTDFCLFVDRLTNHLRENTGHLKRKRESDKKNLPVVNKLLRGIFRI